MAWQFAGQLAVGNSVADPSSLTSALAGAAAASAKNAASAGIVRLTTGIEHERTLTVAASGGDVHARGRRNATPRRRGWLFVAVGDASAIEVVRRQLDLHPVAREDADVVAAHLARDVPQGFVGVVGLHPGHGVWGGLHEPSLPLHLFFLLPN